MGVLWEKSVKGTLYSVRNAGQSVRLYSNGVFHSQWNPDRPFAGAIWDCLSLPCLYRPPAQCRRVLVLGLGGGAGVRQLQTLLNFDSLVAVEIDSVHIHIARKWFGVTQANVQIEHADAISWVKQYSGERFDLIIDDLFGHANKEPLRIQSLDKPWLEQLSGMLNPEGILVANCISRGELLAAVPVFASSGFVQGYRWNSPEYENTIGVFFKRPVLSSQWLAHLNESNLSPAMKQAARWVVRRALTFT